MSFEPAKPLLNQILLSINNDCAIALAQELEHRPTRSLEEETFLELLITLIEKFEVERYLMPTKTTVSVPGHLMDARDLEEADLIPVLGTPKKIV